MHPHTKFEIVTSNNVGDYVVDTFFSRIEAIGQVHNNLKQYATFHYPNMYPQYGISVSYSIGDMLPTRF